MFHVLLLPRWSFIVATLSVWGISCPAVFSAPSCLFQAVLVRAHYCCEQTPQTLLGRKHLTEGGVHYGHDREQGGMQADKVLELRELRLVDNRKSTDCHIE